MYESLRQEVDDKRSTAPEKQSTIGTSIPFEKGQALLI